MKAYRGRIDAKKGFMVTSKIIILKPMLARLAMGVLAGSLSVGVAFAASIGSARLQIGLLLLVLVTISLAPLLIQPFDIFAANTVFIMGYILYSFGILFSFSVFGRTTFLLGTEITSKDLPLLLKSVVLYSAGIIAFHLGYSSKLGRVLAQKLPRFNDATFSHFRLAAIAWIYLIIGSALLALLMVKVGGVQRFLSLAYSERHLVVRGLGYLSIGINLINIGLFLLYYWLRKYSHHRKLFLLIYWIAIALYSYVLLLTGRRAPLFFLIIELLVFHHYGIKRLPLRKLFALGAVGTFILFVWARIRGIVGNVSLPQLWAYIQANISVDWFDPAITEFGAAPFILLTVLRHFPSGGYWLGMSYVNAFLAQVPYMLFPNRPLTPGEWFTISFFPEFYERGGGLGFSYLTEAFLNFGVPGIVVVSFIAGILCATLYNYWRREPNNTLSLVLYAISVPWIILAIRSDFASILKGYVIGYAIPTILALGFITRWQMIVFRRA